jgi:F0F1-type ATP synthase membrane subunit b/b'
MRALIVVSVVIALSLAGCSSVKYRALESIGIEKRDVLSSSVEDAAEAQDEAAEQFASALEQFRATVELDGGDLEDTYDRLNREFERSEARAEEVAERIDDIENVATALFDEWQEELDDYTDPSLRRRSEEILTETRGRYTSMMRAMDRAEASMDPVLNVFRDQVLFLKHNLNSMAIASLRDELGTIEAATDELIVAMNASIAEAREFIETL